MKPKLKLCPFCGGKVKVGNSLGEYLVSCISQKCHMRNVVTNAYDTKIEAIIAWNKRLEE